MFNWQVLSDAGDGRRRAGKEGSVATATESADRCGNKPEGTGGIGWTGQGSRNPVFQSIPANAKYAGSIVMMKQVIDGMHRQALLDQAE